MNAPRSAKAQPYGIWALTMVISKNHAKRRLFKMTMPHKSVHAAFCQEASYD